MIKGLSRFISHNREISAGLLVMLVSVLLIATMSPVRSTQFVLAEWDYPDEYGQGIEAVRAYQNISDSWVSLTPFDLTSGDPTVLEINETATGVKILVKCWLNNTIVGATSFEDGKNYIRHNVTLTIIGDISGEIIFSLQNFTYTTGTDAQDPMFYYQYEGIIPFSPVGGQTYLAVVTYEVQYTIYDYDDIILTATSGSTDAGTPTGDYTDTHSINDVFLGGTDPDEISVILWIESDFEEIGFNYSVYWNASTSGYIYIYNHTSSDWTLLNNTPNGENGPLVWDNGTVENEDYYNSTMIGFKFSATSIIGTTHIYVDYFQIQTFPAAQWNEASEVEFWFNVLMDPWGFNTALIILGLVMIPVSTIYLAYGAKHDRSSDRLFYGLILFMLGCGLFIGGVLP